LTKKTAERETNRASEQKKSTNHFAKNERKRTTKTIKRRKKKCRNQKKVEECSKEVTSLRFFESRKIAKNNNKNKI